MKCLGAILLQLKGAGLVQSTGGYALAKPPEAISLADVMEVLEGPTQVQSNIAVFQYSAAVESRNRWESRVTGFPMEGGGSVASSFLRRVQRELLA